jgi:hypothetical protein
LELQFNELADTADAEALVAATALSAAAAAASTAAAAAANAVPVSVVRKKSGEKVSGDDAVDELSAQLEAVDEELNIERESAAEMENDLDAARLQLSAAKEKSSERESILEVRITQLKQQLAAVPAAILVGRAGRPYKTHVEIAWNPALEIEM